MNFAKRIAVPLLVIVLLLTLLAWGNAPVQAVAEQDYNPLSDFNYTVSDGMLTITGYAGNSVEVRIAPSYMIGSELYTVTTIEAAAFEAQEEITYVELPDTLELVGEYAFYDCLELKQVVVRGKQTQIETGALGFYYISRREDGIVEGFVLEGRTGSLAETYAAENGLTFVAMAADAVSSGDAGYATLAEALSAVEANSVLRLNRDITETLAVNKNVTLDLNGYSIDGTVIVVEGYTLTVKDSTTDDFTAESYGKILVSGKAEAADGYIAVEEDDGISYHRLDLQINSVNLRPGTVGIYYGGSFGGDEAIKSQVEYYGTALSLDGVPTAQEIAADKHYSKHTAFSADSWVCGESGKAYGTLLKGIWKQSNSLQQNTANAQYKIYSVSYVQLTDGTIVLGEPVCMSLRDVVEKADARWSTLDDQQIAGMQAMYKEYEAVMTGWTIPNLEAATSTKTRIYASAVTAAPGETVTVTVNVQNNPGILGMLLSVEYDESVLTLTDTASGSALSVLTYVAPSRLVSGCNFLWYGSTTGAVTDGAVLTLTFEVSNSAEASTYPILLTCGDEDTYDANYQPIATVIANGSVTVDGQPSVVAYTVIFKDYDGTVLKTERVVSGMAAVAPADPIRDGYTFLGWDKTFDKVTGNLVVTALYEAETTETKFYVSKEGAAGGETVTVTVSVKNNPGILGMLLSLEYDESVLTLVGTANGDATAALTYLEPSRLVSGCNFLWYGSATGVVTDGSVLTLTFQVAEGAATGTYPISLAYSSQDTYDASYSPITAVVSDGSVVVG